MVVIFKPSSQQMCVYVLPGLDNTCPYVALLVQEPFFSFKEILKSISLEGLAKLWDPVRQEARVVALGYEKAAGFG